jgi:hypothetical protein
MTSAYRTDRVVYVDGIGATTSIPVTVAPSATIEYRATNGPVPGNTPTTILTYTNNGTAAIFIDGWTGTGQYEGDWTLWLDVQVIDEDRSSASTMRAGRMLTSPIRLEPGSILDIKVEHAAAGTGLFSASIFGHS